MSEGPALPCKGLWLGAQIASRADLQASAEARGRLRPAVLQPWEPASCLANSTGVDYYTVGRTPATDGPRQEAAIEGNDAAAARGAGLHAGLLGQARAPPTCGRSPKVHFTRARQRPPSRSSARHAAQADDRQARISHARPHGPGRAGEEGRADPHPRQDRAGAPIFAVENPEDVIPVRPEWLAARAATFCPRVRGDSMIRRTSPTAIWSWCASRIRCHKRHRGSHDRSGSDGEALHHRAAPSCKPERPTIEAIVVDPQRVDFRIWARSSGSSGDVRRRDMLATKRTVGVGRRALSVCPAAGSWVAR